MTIKKSQWELCRTCLILKQVSASLIWLVCGNGEGKCVPSKISLWIKTSKDEELAPLLCVLFPGNVASWDPSHSIAASHGALDCLSPTVHSFLLGRQWLLHLSNMRSTLVSVFLHLAAPCMSSFTLAFSSLQVYSHLSFLPSIQECSVSEPPLPPTSSQILLGLCLSAPPWNLSRYQEFCQSPGVVCVTRRAVWDSPSLAVSFWVEYNVRKTIYRKFILKRSEEC